jgi:hypothetical protein
MEHRARLNAVTKAKTASGNLTPVFQSLGKLLNIIETKWIILLTVYVSKFLHAQRQGMEDYMINIQNI